jgi:hypothetical protein
MITTKDGGSAFPQSQRLFDNDTQSWAVHSVGGMSLRDWFAGMALQGYMAYSHPQSMVGIFPDAAVQKSYEIADLMLAAREGKEESP